MISKIIPSITKKSAAKKSSTRPSKPFVALKDLFADYEIKTGQNYVTREFQDYGYRLACELTDLEHKSLYIKMAKTVDRAILEQARTFIIDAAAINKAKLFMWKVKQLKLAAKTKVTK